MFGNQGKGNFRRAKFKYSIDTVIRTAKFFFISEIATKSKNKTFKYVILLCEMFLNGFQSLQR